MGIRPLPRAAALLAAGAFGGGCTDDYAAFLAGAAPSTTSSTSTTSGGGGAGATGSGGSGEAGSGATGVGGKTGSGGDGAQGGSGGATCGNGSIEPGEECDPGPGAIGCDAACQVVCNGAGEVEDSATHHCYYRDIDDTERTWDDARAFCKAWGGDLLVLEAMLEYTTLLSSLPIPVDADFFWAGATSPDASSGEFTWIDGQKLTYPWYQPPWMDDQPNFNGDCLCWKASSDPADEGICDLPCSDEHHPFCERPPPGT